MADETPTVAEMVMDYTQVGEIRGKVRLALTEGGFDGLYRCDGGDTCGCGLNDFAPCGEGPYKDCRAAYRHKEGLYL